MKLGRKRLRGEYDLSVQGSGFRKLRGFKGQGFQLKCTGTSLKGL